MTDDDPRALGLRERKRRATRRSILLAAVELVRERGLDGATVDEISRMADVSPRTFFNYFSSKEEAIAGDTPELPGAELTEAFVAGRGALLDDLGELLVHGVELNAQDYELILLRRPLVKQHPQLVAIRMAGMRHFEDDLTDVVARRLARDAEAEREVDAAATEAPDADALHSRARLLVYAVMGAVRHAWIGWADAPGSTSLPDRLRASLVELGELIEQASVPVSDPVEGAGTPSSRASILG